ncbi:MAG: DNA polymerase III subunit delta [Arenicellales bacterium]
MKLSPAQLKNQSSPQSIYHLFGAETLIVEEALNDLRAYLKTEGYIERERLNVETGFNWDTLLESSQALSLFAQKRIIELRMPTGKPGDKGGKTLMAYAQSPAPDTIFILISGDIEKRAQNTKWFKALDAAGANVEAPKVQAYQIINWIESRLQQVGVRAESGVAKIIAHYVEGNLLAAAQEINFLALHSKDEILSAEQVQTLISDQARFTNYAFVDACLLGQASRAVRILLSLKGEKVEPILILSALSRETVKLLSLSHIKAQGKPVQAMYKRLGIWSSRERLINSALGRVSHMGWLRIHSKMTDLDSMSKGQKACNAKDIWEEIERIGLAMCGNAGMLR